MNFIDAVWNVNVRSFAVAGVIAVSFFGFESTASALGVTNGNFTSTTSSGNFQAFTGNGNSLTSTINNWSAKANGNSALSFIYGGNYTAPVSDVPFGSFTLNNTVAVSASAAANAGQVNNNFLVVDADPNYNLAIYQTLTGLSAGTQYAVSFYQAAGAQGPPSQFTPTGTVGWDVTLGTDLVGGIYTAGAFVPTSAPGADANGNVTKLSPLTYVETNGNFTGWTQQTVTFTATAATETLSFLAQGTGAIAGPPVLFLDGVSITATPEPGTIAIAGLGLTVLGMLRRRNRKA